MDVAINSNQSKYGYLYEKEYFTPSVSRMYEYVYLGTIIER